MFQKSKMIVFKLRDILQVWWSLHSYEIFRIWLLVNLSYLQAKVSRLAVGATLAPVVRAAARTAATPWSPASTTSPHLCKSWRKRKHFLFGVNFTVVFRLQGWSREHKIRLDSFANFFCKPFTSLFCSFLLFLWCIVMSFISFMSFPVILVSELSVHELGFGPTRSIPPFAVGLSWKHEPKITLLTEGALNGSLFWYILVLNPTFAL